MDIRATVSQPREVFEEFAKEFQEEFPAVRQKQMIKAELRVEHGKLLPPAAQLLGFQGVLLVNADETVMVQFRPDGFTVNNLKTYIGGDRLKSEVLRLWSRFADRMKPNDISRVAFRYINQLRLPIEGGEDFEKYLTSPPELPDTLPQEFSEFLSRVVAHPSAHTVLAVTQRLTTTSSGPVVLLDIDVSENREFSGEMDDLAATLESLRILRNKAFFALLTENTVNLYA